MSTTRDPALVDERIVARYPRELVLRDETTVTLTPMVPSDWQFVEAFLREIPEPDRQFLRDDISDPDLVERWCAELDYRHVLPLLAWDDARIVADGTLHREPGLWTAHVGRIRLLVHPAYRRRGLGAGMVEQLLELARDQSLHRVVTECAGEQSELLNLLRRLGFHEAARLPEFVRDRRGRFHDMVLMVYSLT